MSGKKKFTEETNMANEDATVVEDTQALSSLTPASQSGGSDPKSKLEYIKSTIGALASMSTTELEKWFKDSIATVGTEGKGVGDVFGKNQSSIDMKPSAAVSSTSPKTSDPMPKLGVKEDIDALYAGQELSEEFREKVTTLFEAAVGARIALEVVRLDEDYATAIEHNTDVINERLTSQLDGYLDYIAEKWLTDNQVAIESVLRNEIIEEFVDGLHKLFAEHYIDVPEEKVDLVAQLTEKATSLEQNLNAALNENIQLKTTVLNVERSNAVQQVAEGLTLAQTEKFNALSESVEFDGDIGTYKKKLTYIRENYFPAAKPAQTVTVETETFEGGNTINESVSHDPAVTNYARAISRTIKAR